MRVSVLFAVRFVALGIAMAGMLTSCHTTSKKPKRDPHQPMTFNERTASRKGEVNTMSKFDKMLSNSSLGDRGATKALGKRSFSTSNYQGNTKFSGSKDYATKDFTQSGKSNRAQTQLSAMGMKKNNQADKTFATSNSRWAGKKSTDDSKVFDGSKHEYKTAQYGEAAKSIENNKRPYFMPATGADKGKTYAEEDVKALLNRN